MTRTQTLMWTALPNGFTKPDANGRQRLKLSIFLSPRLETTMPMGTLGEFPDFEDPTRDGVNWAATINTLSIRLETATGSTPPVRATYNATKTSAPADPALWDRFFGPSMPVKQFQFRDFSKASFRTFRSASVFSTLKDQYAGVAAKPALAFKTPTVAKLIQLPGLRTPPLINVLPTPVLRASAVKSLAVVAPIRQNPAFLAFEQFHTPYPVPPGFRAPTVPPMDFHRAVSALGSYPALMRRLGFIVDIEVPFIPAMASAKRVRVLPVWPDGRPSRGSVLPAPGGQVAHRDASQWTACDLTRSLTGTVTKFMATPRGSQIRDGYYVARSITNPSADPVKLYNVDIDLAASRLVNTAVNAAQMVNQQLTPELKASAEAGEEVSASATLDAAASVDMALPALGQPVIRMAVSGLADRVKSQMALAAAMDAKLASGRAEDNVSYAEDLTRGYRIDVWDDVTRQWHRLCGREGTYSIGDTPITWSGKGTLVDEGWVQFGAVSRPEDVNSDEAPTEMRIHESVFDWSGWSLAVPRPGNALSEPDGDGVSTPTKTFTDPDGRTRKLGAYLHPDLPLNVDFKVPAGDLPRMRFGTTYRFRARAVDLAGNSAPFSKGSTTADPGGPGDSNPLVTRAIVHKRYDPVKPPIVVPVDPPKPSESPFTIVVRSYHDPVTGNVVTENAARHIMPPRTAVTMAEASGGLDSSATGRPMDKALWTVLKARDAYEPPAEPDGSATPQTTVPSPVRYLPDLFARGAALKGLPGVPSTTTTTPLGKGARISGVRIPLTSTKSTTVSSFRVSFEQSGPPWYDRLPFRMNVHGIEGTDARLALRASPKLAKWTDATRQLDVELPKADEIVVGLSSYMGAADLRVMGVHQWSMESFVPRLAIPVTPRLATVSGSAIQTAAPANMVPVAVSTTLPAAANALITTSQIGQNWLLTPPQDLTLVHAVDRPMIAPAFTPQAHMERRPGETHATLVDWMAVHGKSTVKAEVHAEWTEDVDDPAAGEPKWKDKAVKKAAAVFSLTVEKNQTRVLNAGQPVPGAMSNSAWGRIPAAGMLVNDPKVATKPQRHFFGDTKHKKVAYKTTFTSRFEKYFVDKTGLTHTLTSPPAVLHVPSSARPAAPVLKYVMPTFGWERGWETPPKAPAGTSVRRGGGLRIYLERPWFSSGDDEKLGIVLFQSTTAATGLADMQAFTSQWGSDPLWTGASLPANRPGMSAFKQRSLTAYNLKLREYTHGTVMVAGYDVDYDPETKLWYADVVIDHGKAYFPFVKLALARYQPYSLPGYELSPVIVADFVQMTPDRWASASIGPDGLTATMTVIGQTYADADSGRKATVTVQLEKRLSTAEVDLGWTPIALIDANGRTRTGEVDLPVRPRTALQVLSGDTRTTWSAPVKLTEKVAGTSYRAVVREYEWYKTRNTDGTTATAKRLVFAEAIPLSVI